MTQQARYLLRQKLDRLQRYRGAGGRVRVADDRHPAARFRLPNKGRIAVGADADLALVALSDETVLQSSDLFYRHQHSPYVGRKLRGRIARTLLRGVTIYHDGQIVSAPIGRLITLQS